MAGTYQQLVNLIWGTANGREFEFDLSDPNSNPVTQYKSFLGTKVNRDLALLDPTPPGEVFEMGSMLYYNNPEKVPPLIPNVPTPTPPFWLFKKDLGARTFRFSINLIDFRVPTGTPQPTRHLVLWYLPAAPSLGVFQVRVMADNANHVFGIERDRWDIAALPAGRTSLSEFYQLRGETQLRNANVFAGGWQRQTVGTFKELTDQYGHPLITGMMELVIPVNGRLLMCVTEDLAAVPPSSDPTLIDTDGPAGSFYHARRPRARLARATTVSSN